MRVSGPLSKILTEVDAKLYDTYITKENGKPVIYVKPDKYIYVPLQEDLFFGKIGLGSSGNGDSTSTHTMIV